MEVAVAVEETSLSSPPSDLIGNVELNENPSIKSLAQRKNASSDDEERAPPAHLEETGSNIALENGKSLPEIAEDDDESNDSAAFRRPRKSNVIHSDDSDNETVEKGKQKNPQSSSDEEVSQKSLKRIARRDSSSSDEGSGVASHDESLVNEQHGENASKRPSSPSASGESVGEIGEEKLVKPMTEKEAAKQKREIFRESQRRVRETQVSLPYHKPKSYTLQEFLQRRAKLPPAFPLEEKVPPSVAIKMSLQQLEVVTKRMEEREKEIEEIYKSESEPEEEIDGDKEMKGDSEGIVNEDEIFDCNGKNLKDGDSLEEKPPECSGIVNKIQADTEEPMKSKNSSQTGDIRDGINVDENEEQPTDKSDPNTSNNNKNSSLEYEFSLDDLDEEEGNAANKKSPPKIAAEIENVEESKKDTAEITKMPERAPKLTGGPSQMIDLEEGAAVPPKPDGIDKLMERFAKHACAKAAVKKKIEMSIIRFSSEEIVREHISTAADKEEEPIRAFEKPGAKLKELRGALQGQILRRRAEFWQQKKVESADKKEDEEENPDKILDDEEEAELTESSVSDDEEEEEVDDVDYMEKPREKSAFVDDEAEETDIEYPNDDGDENNDADAENEIEEDANDASKSNNKKKRRPLKRIIKAFLDSDDDDDDDDNENYASFFNNKSKSEHTASTETLENDFLPPPHQKQNSKTPLKVVTRTAEEFLLSPVNNLTALKSFEVNSQFLHESPAPSIFGNAAEPSPLKEPLWKHGLQKKLLFDSELQGNEDEIAMLCSGAFPTQSQLTETQQIEDMCSGTFPETAETEAEEKNDENEATADENGVVADETPSADDVNEREKNRDDGDDCHDNLISQLLDEEEMENFKKKLDEEVVASEASVAEECKAGGFVLDSDGEGENLTVKKKRKHKLVSSSDDDSHDSEEPENADEEEEIDSHDSDRELEENAVEYDSEENEIDLRAQTAKLKTTDFFDKEAELSESEWGSADEDEKGLDELEEELGDEDIFDENKERANIERLHMRRMLNEDSHEIKLLQEIYLEDGELHGAGRKRQFKWRNINDVDDDDESAKKADEIDEIYLAEEEDEEHWRRMRHKRESYLKKSHERSQESDSVAVLTNDSQLFRLGQAKVLGETNTPVEKIQINSISQPWTLSNKRGSFLARRDQNQVLARLSEFARVPENPVVPGAPKNARNFVFQTVDPNSSKSKSLSDKKRKFGKGDTPKAIKRLRLSSALVSPIAVKKGAPSKTNRARGLFITEDQ